MRPLADGGGPPIEVTPEELGHAGQRFADGQSRLDAAGTALWQALCGLGGMAGGDEAGETFAGRFDPAVRGLLSLFEGGVRAFGGISRGLVGTARNYAVAEHHSTARAGVPYRSSPTRSSVSRCRTGPRRRPRVGTSAG